ncbi:GEVED domain-containing protein, partial [Microbacterium sp.]|uniref:DUF7927 domain-containing protein n=1 Tax=Microbacterium sp. TaxID=51671 RepID=UPI002810BA7B
PVPAASGTAEYAVTFPAATTTSETYARFRLFPAGVTEFLPTGSATAGEVEDYPVAVLDQEITIEKTSTFTADSRPGDTVTYTVTATNIGTDDYTADDPAAVFDDLAGVVDDAEYNGDAAAVASDGSAIPAPAFISPTHISWAGPLAAGESVEITYTVTLAGGGDGVVRNVAWQPNTPYVPGGPPPATPLCDPAGEDGTDPVTGEACASVEGELPRLSVTKTSDVADLPVDGGEVTYEVTVTNEGPGDYTADAPAIATDDLSEVLDDAEFGEIVSPADGAVFDADAQTLTWSGPLAAGDSVTVSYTVTYDSSAGDNVLYNEVCVPAEQTEPGADNCADVRIPGAELDITKSVDPADGAAVEAGQTVTYTISFASNGETAAAVDKIDDLSDVLDDAALVDGSISVSDAGLTAELDGTDLVITGSVPAGTITTVTYSVVVAAYADQENHLLANVVQNADGSCEVEGCPETSNPIRHFSVTKTATPTDGVEPGDVIEYTITVTNDGEAAYTLSAPAGVTDDLSDVLDDATYNGDVTAVASDGSLVPAPTFGTPVLLWSGPVAVGESVEITFTVTVTNRGDADLVNVATPVCGAGVICDPPTPPVEIVMPRITPQKSSDPASGSDVAAGQVVTYALTFINDGQATGAIDTTDDLSGILDDADLTTAPASSVETVTAVYDADAEAIRIEGDLGVGETATVTYQVTIRPDGERGDNIATNVLTPDVPPYVCADGDATCPPFVPPITEHFIGALDDWKTVDPAAGATVRPGQVMTYTLHFENTGTAAVSVDRDDVLTQVLDDATVTAVPTASDVALLVSEITDGRFSVTGALEPGQLVTVTYEVTVNADGARGDDRLGNFLVNAGEEPPAECVPSDDERPDCTINNVSNVVVTKSANPASGANVAEGQRIVYTLTFTNVSTNAAADDVPVDYTDHMAAVLDDATLTGQPTASADGITATASGSTIRIVGAVPSGEIITVSYAVMVKSWANQGDHRLGNVVAITGEEPICAAGSQLCTVHDAIEPDPLAVTGGDVAWGIVIGGVLLLLVGGAVLMIARSRRNKADESS